MTDLVERYVHQVGIYLPKKERADIKAELRSQIHDQMEDRFGGEPTEDETAMVLTEWGHPYVIAKSYGSEQYLVGPEMYPFMMMVLRYGLMIVSTVILFLSIFGVVASSEPITLTNFVLQPVFSAVQATFLFWGTVIFIFAVIQRWGDSEQSVEFKPMELPEVDDPSEVDRSGSIFAVIFGIIASLAGLYYLQVGGLTLSFDLRNPGDVIPVPSVWMALFMINALAMSLVHAWALRQNRWTAGVWLFETVLEMFGGICLYFVLYTPVYQRAVEGNPSLANVPIPEIIAVVLAISTLVSRGRLQVKLWSYQ